MRRKKAAVAVEPVVEGVIDLDEERPTLVPTPQTQYEAGVKELNEDNPTKPKRKYTRRNAKKAQSLAPAQSFVDTSAIRSARVQAFIDYVDGNKTFDEVAAYDDHLKKLLETAAEISVRLLASAHAKATEKINKLADAEKSA